MVIGPPELDGRQLIAGECVSEALNHAVYAWQLICAPNARPNVFVSALPVNTTITLGQKYLRSLCSPPPFFLIRAAQVKLRLRRRQG